MKYYGWVSVMIGKSVSHYRIIEKLGQGGMGEVYRATDNKLGRDVAIKVLPEEFAHDPMRLSRFEREAKMLAALNHPHIAQIYGLEDSHGTRFLVMEFVPGETLAERIQRGPTPIDEALGIVKQIAEALEAAHEKGVVHRDLKPANVKLTPEGNVKVLDFGLAKAYAGETTNENIANSPTLSRAATMQGVILGTAAYMSPEQARGKTVDKRTDIWAFGCVLYELLTGRQVFAGENITDILAALVKSEPDWAALPPDTPPAIHRLLRRCLAKDRQQRLQDIGDARIEISDAPADTLAGAPICASTAPIWKLALPWAAGLLAGALIAGFAVWHLRPATVKVGSAIARVAVPLKQGDDLAGQYRPTLALSPDGTQLAYVACRGDGPQQLCIRAIDSLEGRPFAGTGGAETPFFSPDGQWVGFCAQGKLKKVSINSGSVQTLCDSAINIRGGSWAPDNTIFFVPGGSAGIWKVSAAGGTPKEVTRLDRGKGEVGHRLPQVLPGGKAVLFTVWMGPGSDEKQIQAVVLATGERRTLLSGGHTGRYVSSGHLVYARGTSIMAVPFDLDRLEVIGDSPVSLLEGVSETGEGSNYALSDTGMLAYVVGASNEEERRMVWVDRKGKIDVLPAPPKPYGDPRISPDGRNIAVTVQGGFVGLWIFNLARATLAPLTSEGSSQAPAWTPDGKRIAYRGTRKGYRNLWWRPSDGSGQEERLTEGEFLTAETPTGWAPNGELLLFNNNNDVLLLSVAPGSSQAEASGRRPKAITSSEFVEQNAAFSPDGRWVAYSSDQPGRREIYVQPYPGPGERRLISKDGGDEPIWSRQSPELFYRNGNKMMAVDIFTQSSFSVGTPHMLFAGNYRSSSTRTFSYDVSADGQRFLMIQSVEPQVTPTQINLVLNWFEDLKRKVPTGK